MKYFKLKFLLIFAALAMAIPPAWAETVVDEITAADLAATTSSYANFSDVTKPSGAVYAGRTALNGTAIQMNSSSPMGIVSTTSGGTVKSITIYFSTLQSSTKTVNVYGKNSAYSNAGDLYDAGTRGTLIEGLSSYSYNGVKYTIDGEYQYIGIRSNSNAAYIDKIEIEWSTPEDYEAEVAPTGTLDFGKTAPNTSVTKNVTVKNTGLQPITPVVSVTGAEFRANYTAATIAKGETATIPVVFTPTSTGTFEGSIHIGAQESDAISLDVSLSGMGAYELTVCDGTTTNTKLPINGLYVDEYEQNHQMIYPAAMLQNMNGKDITSMTFYVSSGIGFSTTATFSLKNLSANTPGYGTPPVPIEGYTAVKTEVVSKNSSLTEWTITFDEPFTYSGGDLLLNVATTIGSYGSTYFYGTDQQTNQSYYIDKSSGETPSTFLPKVTFTFEGDGGVVVEPDPTLSVNPTNLTIGESGGTFTVTGANLVDNVGCPNEHNIFNTTYSGDVTWGFVRDANNEVHGTVTVSYEGRDLTATDTFVAGTDPYENAPEDVPDIQASVTVTYQPDLYIYCDLIDGNNWRYYPNEPQMAYADGVYTKTVTITNPGSCILFARAAGLTYNWNDDRQFFGAKNGSDWVYGTDTSTGLVFNGSGNDNQYYPIKFNQPGEYKITINAAEKTFTITSNSVNSIAEAQAFEGPTFTYMGSAVVTYQNGENLWIRDNSGSGLIVGNTDIAFENGDILAAGWSAGNAMQYSTIPIFNNPTGINKGEGTAVADPLPLTEITSGDVNKYASMSGVTVTAVNGKKYTVTLNDVQSILYDQFQLFTSNPLKVGHIYNVVGVVTIYSGTPELYLTEVEDITPMNVTLQSETTSATVGNEIPVTVVVENAVGDYVVTYKFGENGTVNTLTDGNVINVTSETAGEVTLYVTVTNNGHEATAQATYTFTEPVQPGSNVFKLLTDLNQLQEGKQVIIANKKVASNDASAMGEQQNNNFKGTPVSISNDLTIEATEATQILTLESGEDAWYFKAENNEYLYAASSSANQLKTQATKTDNAKATIVIGETGNTQITFQGDHTRNRLRYNDGSDLFSCYSSGQQDIYLYVQTASTPEPEPLSISLTAAPEEAYTVGDDVTVTATVENGSDEAAITYQINDGEWQDYPEGGIVLPNTAAGDVKVTVKVTDGTDEATAEMTYHFNAAGAITFDLVADPDQENYTVGDVVNVKVENIKNVIGDDVQILYTTNFTRDDEPQTYDPEKGIDITSNEAGTVTLQVTITDGYEHAAAAEKSADYKFNAAEAIEIAFDPVDGTIFNVGVESKVKVTVTGTVGDDVTVTYMIGEETVEPVDGYIVLPNNAVGDVTLTVNVNDGVEHEGATTATATYHFAKQNATVTFGIDSDVAVLGTAYTAPTATTAPAGLEVTYASSDVNVATVNENGEVTLQGEGTTTITATVVGNDMYNGGATASYTLTVQPMPVVAVPEFSLVSGSYTGAQTLNITCATEGAVISYSTDGGKNWTQGNTVNLTEDCTIIAKAEKAGMAVSGEANAYFIIDMPVEIPALAGGAIKGYFAVKNNGNGMYANVQGRKTLNFTDAIDQQAGTVIWVETNEKGQVQSLRSQGADLQGYADRAMRYVPELVELAVNKLHAEGAGNILGEHGLDEIMAKFNECFDHHLYVEDAEGGYRLYGKTPSMQPVVDFYREHTHQVETKLPMLVDFINSTIDKILEKTNGAGTSVLKHFDLHETWERMGGTLTEPVDSASTMAFYREVLNNKNYVWDFAYETAITYWERLKASQTYQENIGQLGEFADYLDMIEQVRPDFKYYVVQENNKPDYISQGNKDIINNAARTIWTLEPRADFMVSVTEENQFGCPYADGIGGYATTLYTDFAYDLHEAVTAYKVTGVKNGNAVLEALTGTIPAQTPVLLVAKAAGDYNLTLSTATPAAVTGNLLVGVDYLINRFELKTAQVETLFNLVKSMFGDSFYESYVKEYEHLMMLNAGTVNNKYFWGLSNSDLQKCVYVNESNKKDCVVRNLVGGEFVNNWQAPTANKAFLVSETDATIALSSLRGDVNHDGVVNIHDVTALINHLLTNHTSPACPYCSDVYQDSHLSIKDVTALINLILSNGGTLVTDQGQD